MITLALLIVLIASIWILNRTAYPLSSDPKVAKAQVQRLVPNGTALETARKQLAGMGFRITEATHESFDDEATETSHLATYVRCVIQRRGLVRFPEYMWTIALVPDNAGHVTNVFVRISNRSLIVP
jgi:hypothetical protein